jgi:hypothetical protein
LAAALRITTAAAARQIDLALAVADNLAHTWVALHRGELSIEHVTAIWRATEHCPARVTQAVDVAIVPLAVRRGWTPQQIRKHARAIILKVDPDGAAERAGNAKNHNTDVEFYAGEDEMATVSAHGNAATAREMYDTINARAAQMSADPNDHRTAGQRRFDAMAEFVLGRDERSNDGVARAQQRARQSGQVQVRVELDTLLGLNNNPGELDGYGPITGQLARDLAIDANWRRFVADPMTGQLLDLGRSSYTPSAPLRRFIEALHPTCQSVGCERPARRCQIDHKTEWDKLGCTDCDNLHPLCLMHHQQKTKKRWNLHQHPDGDYWTSALGFTYRRDDTPYDIPLLEPPAEEYDETAEPPPTSPIFNYLPAPEPPPPPDDEPPLDPYETAELYDVLENSWGEFASRAYNLLRAAQLIA